jgi:hypothetical protein
MNIGATKKQLLAQIEDAMRVLHFEMNHYGVTVDLLPVTGTKQQIIDAHRENVRRATLAIAAEIPKPSYPDVLIPVHFPGITVISDCGNARYEGQTVFMTAEQYLNFD